jgi:hypothetical protein
VHRLPSKQPDQETTPHRIVAIQFFRRQAGFVAC